MNRQKIKQLKGVSTLEEYKKNDNGYNDVVYENCGCEAAGHNVASFCPFHPQNSIKKEMIK